ncbi:MAG TPA: hypothetical protein DC038_12750, partial [Clostridiales bacterium]|nr:hypothetical protein [Clostridiales bacterium]
MKKLAYILIAAIILTSLYAIPVFAEQGKTEHTREFKVIGYYSGDLFDEPVENLQTDKLTHVIYAFLIPKSDGTLVELSKPEQ